MLVPQSASREICHATAIQKTSQTDKQSINMYINLTLVQNITSGATKLWVCVIQSVPSLKPPNKISEFNDRTYEFNEIWQMNQKQIEIFRRSLIFFLLFLF